MTELARPQTKLTSGQTVRLLIALSLLMVALTVVVVKDHEFWFGSDEASESGAAGTESAQTGIAAVAPVKTAQATPASGCDRNEPRAPKTPAQSVTDSSSSRKDAAKAASASPSSPVVAANRVVLPPLDIEVVAGDTHRTVHAGSNIAKVELHSDTNRTSAGPTSVDFGYECRRTRALSSAGIPELRQTVEATYPVLGPRMQGAGFGSVAGHCRRRRHHRKPARSERPRHPGSGGAASRAAMALQTLPRKRASRSKPKPESPSTSQSGFPTAPRQASSSCRQYKSTRKFDECRSPRLLLEGSCPAGQGRSAERQLQAC